MPPPHLDFWPFDLEGVGVACDLGYPCAKFRLPRPFGFRVRADVRDIRQTDSDHRLMPPPPPPPTGRGHNNPAIMDWRRQTSRKNCSYLYLDLVVRLAVVDTDDAANHLGYDDHITQVSFHTLQRSSILDVFYTILQRAMTLHKSQRQNIHKFTKAANTQATNFKTMKCKTYPNTSSFT